MSRFPLKTFQQDAILKRLSMGLVALETTNIKTLSDSELDKLQCGDVVVKKTGQQEHAYVVTYKQDKHGICLTYSDASVVETQSYDYDSVHKTWVYNGQDVSFINRMEQIVDADGHNRFIEDDITSNVEHCTLLYGKWSLSGSHLLIVIAGDVEDGVAPYVDFKVTNLPSWIMNKIIPISGNYVVNDVYGQYKDDGARVSRQLLLIKHTDYLKIRLNGISTDVTSYPHFRGQVDLLIDNE